MSYIAPDLTGYLEADRPLKQGDMVIIQVALSKEQIDDVISRSRQIKHRTGGR